MQIIRKYSLGYITEKSELDSATIANIFRKKNLLNLPVERYLVQNKRAFTVGLGSFSREPRNQGPKSPIALPNLKKSAEFFYKNKKKEVDKLRTRYHFKFKLKLFISIKKNAHVLVT